MPEYQAGVTIDGWASLRVKACSREEARRKIKAARPRFFLVNERHELVGAIGDTLFEIDAESIEVYKSAEENDYHAPVPRERRKVSLS